MTGARVEIPARRIGRHAYDYLAMCERMGKAVGSFRSGISVKFGEGAGARLVTLQTPDVPLHPWAIEIAVLPRNIRMGALATTSANTLSIRHWRYDWQRVRPCDLAINAYSNAEAIRARRRLRHHVQASICSQVFEQFLLMHLGTDLPSAELEWIRDPLKLIGFGPGATPLGDDVLVGMLAAWTSLLELRPSIQATLNVFAMTIRNHANDLTNLPSAQMLTAAIDGSFAEPVRSFVRALGCSAASESEVSARRNHLLAQGATSGSGTLFGFDLAYHAACGLPFDERRP